MKTMGKTLWSMLVLGRAEKAKQVRVSRRAVSQAEEYTDLRTISTIIAAMMQDQQVTILNNQRIT